MMVGPAPAGAPVPAGTPRPDRPRKGARPLGVGPLTQQARTKCKGGPAQKE